VSGVLLRLSFKQQPYLAVIVAGASGRQLIEALTTWLTEPELIQPPGHVRDGAGEEALVLTSSSRVDQGHRVLRGTRGHLLWQVRFEIWFAEQGLVESLPVGGGQSDKPIVHGANVLKFQEFLLALKNPLAESLGGVLWQKEALPGRPGNDGFSAHGGRRVGLRSSRLVSLSRGVVGSVLLGHLVGERKGRKESLVFLIIIRIVRIVIKALLTICNIRNSLKTIYACFVVDNATVKRACCAHP
jgi:hypothetical protein